MIQSSKIRLPFIIILAGLLAFSCGNGRTTEHPPSGDDRTMEHPPSVDDRATEPPVHHDQATAISQEMFREACLNGMSGEVQNYLRKGADPDAADMEGRTGLMLAAYNGHAEIVEMLLERSVEVHRTDGMGRTALMYASTGRFPATVEVLLSHGADPDMADFEEGFTALMFAAAEGNPEVVQLLLDHGADPDLKDTDGDTAGDFARRNGHLEVAELLGG